MDIRDKKHWLWRSLGFIIQVISLSITGVFSLIKCAISLPVFFAAIIMIASAPMGAMEPVKQD